MFDIGEHEGERFLTMEFVEGQMLSARIGAGSNGVGRPLPQPLLLPVTEQVCAGLSAAHAVGVIHRDLKPDNVMLGNDGRVAITDFGIARAWQPTAAANAATNEFVGTPEYMSPEQAEGGAIDLRTDIYSLGIMLFELLTGTVPFIGATPLITAAARLIKPPPDPRSRRPEVPEAVAQVVLRCLARLPQDRYASADLVAVALAEALQTSPGSFSGSMATISATRSPSVQIGTYPSTQSPADGTSRPTAGLSVTLDAPAGSKSIAVLPFRNQGPAEDAYLADGLTDDLIDALSMAQGLRVCSRAALLAQSNQPDPLAMGRALSLDVLVEGTVRRIGQQLRITARLIQVADGVQAWTQRFDRPAADALQVSDEMANAVAAALTVGAMGQKRAVLSDAEAVDLYLRARAISQRGSPDSLRESVPLYEQALALRPNDPTLLTAYAQVRSRLWFFGGEGSGDLARVAAEKAVAAAPDRGEPHQALAAVRFNMSDSASAVRELKLALKLAPGLAAAHELLGRILIESGPYELGLRHIEHALELEPWLARAQFDRARVHALLGRWDVADQICEVATQTVPIIPGAWIMLCRLCMWRGDRARAEAELLRPELAKLEFPAPRYLLEITAGRARYETRQLFGTGIGSAGSSPRGRAYFHQVDTEINSLYGELDNAIRALARAVDVGLYDRLWIDSCPLLVPLRVDLRFRALRKIVIDRATQVQDALYEKES